MKDNPFSRLLGFSIYGIGVAIGFLLITVAAWADMESSAYGFPRLANAGLGGLHCPVLMTPDEISTISLDVSNKTGDRISPAIKTLISTRLLPEEFLEGMQLIPGESKRLEWPVDAENIDMGNFVFAKVLLYSAYPLPSREATCGIFVLDLPGTGKMIMPVLVALSLVSMGWGIHSLHKSTGPNERLRKYMSSMIFLALLIGLGFVLSFVGGWISSLLVVVVTLLLIIILVGSLVVDKSR
jgi:hypothetical protein